MWASGADVAKVATTARDITDARRMLALLEERSGSHLFAPGCYPSSLHTTAVASSCGAGGKHTNDACLCLNTMQHRIDNPQCGSRSRRFTELVAELVAVCS